MDKSREILKKYWGFDHFRPEQEEIIKDVLYGHDTLALLPTGGGKSICFQVPGILREGITIVISPLIALMQDQVNNLLKKGIRAKAIVSGMSYREIDITLDNAKYGGIDFLYTSPERIQSTLFIERFKQMKIGLLVVDEAHCISEWGHDFRPAYREIVRLRAHHPDVPVIALTATATDHVRLDIAKQLQLKKPAIHIASFERKNIIYKIFHTTNKVNELLDYLSSQQGKCGIVYCQTRRSVKEIAKIIHVNQYKTGIYHGGMTKNERHQMLQDWLSDKINIMVATNAFGMGIDKPNVRFVIHYEVPATLEAYFQEAGRAGRDEGPAEAVAFWEDKDIKQLKINHEQKFVSIETIKRAYLALCNYLKIAIGSGKDETYHFDLQKLSENFQFKPVELYSSFKMMELNGDLTFSEGVFHPTKLKLVVGNLALYNFQINHPKLVPLTTLLVRSYPGIFDNYVEIHENEFSKRLKINSQELKNQLIHLEKYGILEISWSSSLPTVTFLKERVPDSYFFIAHDIYGSRKKVASDKLDSVIHFLQIEECRSVQLLRYFGQKVTKCRKCDVCLSEQNNKTPLSDLKLQIIQLLSTSMSLDEITEHSDADKEHVVLALKELLLDQKIIYNDSKYSVKS